MADIDKFNIYIEKEKFDEIILFNENYPNWMKILSDNTQILLNMTDEDFINELNDIESPIYLFEEMNASDVKPKALGSQFVALKDDMMGLINHPRGVFIFDIEPNEASKVSKSLGVAVISSDDLNDNYFKGGLFKEFASGQIVEGGWKSVLPPKEELQVSNALVISDCYLFENEENGLNYGLSNLPNLLDAFLPKALEIEYHITILAQNGDKSRSWWIKKFGAFKAKIELLRNYEIRLELFLTKGPHKRRFISNYLNGWADKGFSMFKISDPNQVRDYNEDFYDFHLHKVFDNIDHTGDTHFKSATNGLQQVKKCCDKVSDDIKKIIENESSMIFGDCNKDKTTINRLL